MKLAKLRPDERARGGGLAGSKGWRGGLAGSKGWRGGVAGMKSCKVSWK